MDLAHYTTEELEMELEKRKRAENKPTVLPNFDFGPLIELCQKYIDTIGTKDVDSDIQQYIFEAAMETFFGKDVWEYINERLMN